MILPFLKSSSYSLTLDSDFLSISLVLNFLKFRFLILPINLQSLDFTEGKSIDKISKSLAEKKLEPSEFYLAKKNFGQWFKSIFK